MLDHNKITQFSKIYKISPVSNLCVKPILLHLFLAINQTIQTLNILHVLEYEAKQKLY